MRSEWKEDLHALAEADGRTCISLYMPTKNAGKERLQNPTAFKNVLRDARSQLAARSVPERTIDSLLEPAVALVDNYDFWQHQKDGLAVFLAGGLFRFYQLPYLTSTHVVVAKSFLLKPLFPLFAEDGWFYILSLSRNGVEFYRADRFDIDKLPLDGAPVSLAEFLRFDVEEKNVQMHAAGPPVAGRPTGVIHGRGFNKEDTKIRLLQFFQRIDRALQSHLRNENAPLVLAGVEPDYPIYREANTYRHLLPEVIPGAPESHTTLELRNKAWETVAPHFNRERDAAAAAIEHGLTRNRAVTDLEKVVNAASHGQVGTAFVAMEEEAWGAFHPDSGRIELLAQGHPDARDLVDYVGVRTLIHDGRVFPVQREGVPGGGPVAALLRC